jgi:hypothetical protein
MFPIAERGDRQAGKAAYRLAAVVALATASVLVWGNLALGVIGDEDNNANLMYLGVLAVGAVAAVIGRFQPEGMLRAMCGTAVAQAFVGVVALVGGQGSAWDVAMLTVFFVGLWLLSAWLFAKAARVHAPARAATAG